MTSLYDGMREMRDDMADTLSPDMELEIGGKPIWYSTCDAALLVYSGKCLDSNYRFSHGL